MIRPVITQRPTTVINIIKANFAVFLLWLYALYSGYDFMAEHFLVSWKGLLEGRVWTLVTSVFSHNMLFHILINMYVLFGFGAAMENTLGARRFLRFYLTAGIVASLGHCFVSTVLLDVPELPALGASGAVAGTILLFSLMYPKEKILLLGIIPMPAITAALVFVGIDLWGLIAQTRGSSLPIGYGAHLGGALYGLLYYLISVKKRSGLRSDF